MNDEKIYGDTNYASTWDEAFKKRDENKEITYSKEEIESHLNKLAINSTKKGKKERKSLIDYLNTKKGKMVTVGVLSSIILLGTSLKIIDGVTKDKRAAIGMCKDKMCDVLEENGVIERDNNRYRIVNLDNLSKVDLDSEEDIYAALLVFEDTTNYNDIAAGYGEYNVREKTATSTTYDGYRYYSSYSNVLTQGGYFNENGKPSTIVYYNYMEAEMEKMYKDGTLEDYLEDTLGPGTKGAQR